MLDSSGITVLSTTTAATSVLDLNGLLLAQGGSLYVTGAQNGVLSDACCSVALIDNDGDGLTDEAEGSLYGTDAGNSDTDGDGLSDGSEVITYGTSPVTADSDSDGLGDGEEVNTHNTDPNNTDTDGGSVSDGDEVNNGTNPTDPSDDVADSGGPDDSGEDTDVPGGDTGKGDPGECGCSSNGTTTTASAVFLAGLGLLRRRRRS